MLLVLIVLCIRPQGLIVLIRRNAWSIQFIDAGNYSREATIISDHPHAMIWISRSLVERGKLEEAKTLLSYSNKSSPFRLSLLGMIASREGDATKASRLWELAEDPQSIIRNARNAFDSSDYESAAIYYLTLTEMGYPSVVSSLIDILEWRLNDINNAQEVLTDAITSFPQDREQHEWMRRLGDILRKQGEWDKAKDLYLIVLNEDPSDCQALIGLGWIAFYQDGNEIAAERFFLHTVELLPDVDAGYSALGKLKYRLGEYSASAQWFQRATEKNPKNHWHYLNLVNSLRMTGNNNAAIDVYQNALKIIPNNPNIYSGLSLLYQEKSEWILAIDAIENAIFLAERSDNSLESYYLRAGSLYQATGDLDKARKAYESVLIINPNNESAKTELHSLNAGE